VFVDGYFNMTITLTDLHDKASMDITQFLKNGSKMTSRLKQYVDEQPRLLGRMLESFRFLAKSEGTS